MVEQECETRWSRAFRAIFYIGPVQGRPGGESGHDKACIAGRNARFPMLNGASFLAVFGSVVLAFLQELKTKFGDKDRRVASVSVV